MIFCPRYAHYFSFLFGCTFRLFFFFLRIDRIQSIVLILLFTMPPNINNTGHIKIPVHMHTGECITLLILSLCFFFSYSFFMFITPLSVIIFSYISHSILYQSYFNFVRDCPFFYVIYLVKNTLYSVLCNSG